MSVSSTKIGSYDLQNSQPSAHSDRKALGGQKDFTEGQNPARRQGASGSHLGERHWKGPYELSKVDTCSKLMLR